MAPKHSLPFYLEWFWHQTVQDQAFLIYWDQVHFSLLGKTVASSRPMHPRFLDMQNQTVHVKILSLPGFETQQDQALGLAVTVKLLLVPCSSKVTAYFKYFSFSGKGDGIFLERRSVWSCIVEYWGFLSMTSAWSDSWVLFSLAKVIIWLHPKYHKFIFKETFVLSTDSLCLINVF